MKDSEISKLIEKAEFFKSEIKKCGPFRLDKILNEAEGFFSELRRDHPEIYPILEIQEKQVHEIAFRKKTGKKVIMD